MRLIQLNLRLNPLCPDSCDSEILHLQGSHFDMSQLRMVKP